MPLTFDSAIDKLKKNHHFKFSRFGDGEWFMILDVMRPRWRELGDIPTRREAGKKLREIIESKPQYYIGRYRIADELMGSHVRSWTRRLQLSWSDAHIFEDAFIDGRFQEFIDALKKRTVLMVGRDYLQKIKPYGIEFSHVVTASERCWLYEDELFKSIQACAEDVVLISASVVSCILIDRLKDENLTIIDTGSLFDIYCGIKSRPWQDKIVL